MVDELHNGSSMAQQVVEAKRAYLPDINFAKGLAILLVVFGHVVTGTPPDGAGWYMAARAAIYAFHMPFFIYLSGFMLFYTRPDIGMVRDEWSFILRRAHRLLVPFALFGLAIVIGKHASAQFGHVDHLGVSIADDVINLVWDTRRSAAQSVWYIFVLFELTIIVALGRRLVASPLKWLIVAIPLSVIAFPPVFYLDRFFLYLPFFLFGGWAALHYAKWLGFIDRYWLPALVIFIAAIGLTRVIGIYQLSILLCGFTSIPALHGLCRRTFFQNFPLFDVLGRYSFVIYLLNTVAIGCAKALLFKASDWNGWHFLVFLPTLCIVGLLLPIIVKRFVFSRSKYIDNMTS